MIMSSIIAASVTNPIAGIVTGRADTEDHWLEVMRSTMRRFFENLPESSDDVDIEVLKRVPAPV
jgi:hypothetical protein